jgi:iron complex transport system substrate-binding protein
MMPRCLTGLLAALLWSWAGLAAATSIVDDRGRTIDLPAPPQRVVSLLPSLTETVCALQACGRLVGVDRFSSFPASVRTLPQLGGLEAQVQLPTTGFATQNFN